MGEYSSVIAEDNLDAQQAAARDIDESPEDAAKSLRLSDATGVPALVVHLDPEIIARQTKAQAAAGLIQDNPQLANLALSDPMAPKVAANDWAQLDRTSQAMSHVGSLGLVASVLAISRAARAGFEEGADTKERAEEVRQAWGALANTPSPLGKTAMGLALLGGGFLSGVADLFGGTAGAASGAVGELFRQNGLDPWQGQSIVRELAQVPFALEGMPGERAVSGEAHTGPRPAPESFHTAGLAANKADPYIRAGQDVPRGLDPTIDALKKEDSKAAVDRLSDAVKEAAKSQTRELAPEMFRRFAEEHVGQETVGIDAQTAVQLYGGKTPEVGDGLLGFVPDIAQQYEVALRTGADIQVPVKDLLAYVDPEVYRQIEPGIRPTVQGFTQLEEPKSPEVVETPEEAVKWRPTAPIEDVTPPSGRDRLLDEPGAIGMTKAQGKQYAALIERFQQEEYNENLRLAQKAEEARAKPEWAQRQKEVREQVIQQIANTPKFAADVGMRNGEVPKVDARYLTDKQKAALPRMYWGMTGDIMPPDALARTLGYDSGDALVEDLATLHANRQGTAPKVYLERLTRALTERQMRDRYGDFSEEMLKSARDLVLSPTHLDLLHAELEDLAAQHGVTIPYTKDAMRQAVADHFAGMRAEDIDSDRYMAAAVRAAGRIEAALLKGDPVTAFKAREEKWLSLEYAAKAREVEKLQEQVGRIEKRYGKITGETLGKKSDQYAIDWVNQLHNQMQLVGRKVRRSRGNVAEAMELDGYQKLSDFAQAKGWSRDGFALADVPLPDWVIDGEPTPNKDDMTVDQFRQYHALMRALDKGARNEGKAEFQGKMEDLQELKDRLIGQLKAQFPEGKAPKVGVRAGLERATAALTKLETVFNRFDHFMPGDWYETFTRQYAKASADEDNLLREYTDKIHAATKGFELGLRKGQDQHGFWLDPRANYKPFADWTREKTLAVLMNAGNASNLKVLAEGYGRKPEEVMEWLRTHTTKEDWDWAQRIGDVYQQAFDLAQQARYTLTGSLAERVRLDPIEIHGQTYGGWYHPLIADRERVGYASEAAKKVLSQEVNDRGYAKATVNEHWARTRTGVSYPLQLDLADSFVRMRQMLHDVATRGAVQQLSKFFYDKQFMQAIATHYGDAYADLMVPLLRDFAGSADMASGGARWAEQVGGKLQANLIQTFIGFNPHTIEKHTFTAAVHSMDQVGIMNFARAFKDVTTNWGEWQRMREKSPELKRRLTNFQQMARDNGADINIRGTQGAQAKLANLFQWAGHAPIGFFDLISAVPTFKAEYERALAAGEDEGAAIDLGDRAVRLAHGSATLTNKPELMRSRNPVVKTLVPLMNFFNHIFNKQWEIGARVNDAMGLVRDGEFTEATKRTPKIVGMMMYYVALPALIEEAVSGQLDNKLFGKNIGWGQWLAELGIEGLGSSIVGGRDMIHALFNLDRHPSFGVLGDMGGMLTNPVLDAVPKKGESVGHRWTHGGRGMFLRDTIELMGMLRGMGNTTVGNAAKFMSDYMQGVERPQTARDWWRGLTTGTAKDKGHVGITDVLRKELGYE